MRWRQRGCSSAVRLQGALSAVMWQPVPSCLENSTSDWEAEGESERPTEDAGTNKPDSGLVQVSVLERRDGTDAGRPPVLGKNDVCKRDRCKSLAAPLASC